MVTLGNILRGEPGIVRHRTPDEMAYVINRYRKNGTNLGATFTKIIKRAALEPRPKLFNNLRASRETELLATYPAKDVSSWLGNSVPIAMKHYAMPRAETFERPAREGVAVEAVQQASATASKKAAIPLRKAIKSSDLPSL